MAMQADRPIVIHCFRGFHRTVRIVAGDAGKVLCFLVALALVQLFDVADHFHAIVTESILIINSVVSESLAGAKVPLIFTCPTCFTCRLQVALLANRFT